MKKTLILAALFVFVLGVADALAASITIRVAHDNNVTEPGHIGFLAFKKEVEEKSGGRIEVKIFPGGQVGGVQDMFEQTRRGDLQMATGATTLFVQTIPEFAVWDSFYMFDDYDHVHRVLDGKAGKELMKPIERMNLVGLGYMDIGFRNLSNSRRPIVKAEDVEGLKIRGYSPIQIKAWEAAGTNLTNLAWAEVFTSLQQNLIDGQECAIANFYNSRFYEAQKYLSLTKHIFTNWLLYANKRFMDKLSPEDKKIVLDAAKTCIKVCREEMVSAESRYIESIKATGCQVNEMPLEERQKLGDKMNKAVNDLIIEKCGRDLYDMVHAEIARERR